MSPEENKAVVRGYLEHLNARDLPGIGAYVADDIVLNGRPWGLDGYRKGVTTVLEGFPDTRWQAETLIAEGDLVSLRLTRFGTHLGTYTGIAPTGRATEVAQQAIYRIVGGKIVEVWTIVDTSGMLQQLGLEPAPRSAAGQAR